MIEWYCTVLGAELLYQNKQIAFISYDDEHHRVAFIDPGPLGRQGAGRGQDGAGRRRSRACTTSPSRWARWTSWPTSTSAEGAGDPPHRCVNHGVTTSMYYYDPDRNQVELLVDNFETAIEGQDYMRRRSATDKNPVGIDFDPEELVKKIQSGLKLEELQTINA